MSPPPDGVNAQDRWPGGMASPTYSLYTVADILVNIGSGLLPDSHQATIWTNANLSIIWNFEKKNCKFPPFYSSLIVLCFHMHDAASWAPGSNLLTIFQSKFRFAQNLAGL